MAKGDTQTVPTPANFVEDDTFAAAEYTANIINIFNSLAEKQFEDPGDLIIGAGGSSYFILGAGTGEQFLVFDGTTVRWAERSTLKDYLQSGDVTRDDLEPSARLPDPTGQYGKYVKVNAAGTGFELEDPKTFTVQHLTGSTISGFLADDRISVSINIGGDAELRGPYRFSSISSARQVIVSGGTTLGMQRSGNSLTFTNQIGQAAITPTTVQLVRSRLA